MSRTYRVADLFCGAGGSSSGAQRAIRALGAEMDLVAVNHWDTAIATHSRNHPTARHHCVDLDAARPEALVPEGSLDLLMASPECVFFSRARGGRPVHDQRRMSAWHVNRWCSTLDVRCILVENVPEFVTWGPLLPNGHPDKTKRGLYFQAWIQSLMAMGYEVGWRLLNAADFGDATTRTRFFLQARKDGMPIRWPEPTHAARPEGGLFGARARWRAAREVIDWANVGRSIFARPKPLSDKTRRRIARGLERFGGPLAPLYVRLLDLEPTADGAAAGPGPFIVVGRENNVPKSVDDPLGTVTTIPGIYVVEAIAEPFVFANRNHAVPKGADEPVPTITSAGGGGLFVAEPTCEPFVLGQQSGAVGRSVDAPLPTIATDGAIALVEPLVVEYHGNGSCESPAEPLGTITTRDRFGLASPLAVPYGPRAEARGVDRPLQTITTKDRLGLATPLVVRFHGDRRGLPRSPSSVEEPLPTVTAEPRFGLAMPTAEPFVLSRFSGTGAVGSRSVDSPLPTATGDGAGYLVQPFLVPKFGERGDQVPRVHSVADPLPTVTSEGAGRLCEPVLVQIDQAGSRWGDQARSVDEPLGTLVAQPNVAVALPVLEAATGAVDPRRLVLIDGQPYLLDIRFRMLTNRELARAMGFDDDEARYEFSGTKGEVTRQIGNAVAVGTAAALVGAILGEGARAGSEAVA